jgi:hypothetical protein
VEWEVRATLDEAVEAGELPDCHTPVLAERVYISYHGVLITGQLGDSAPSPVAR